MAHEPVHEDKQKEGLSVRRIEVPAGPSMMDDWPYLLQPRCDLNHPLLSAKFARIH